MKDSINPLLQPNLSGLPRGPHGLARELVTGSQRQRLLYAIVVAVADKGYIAATVGDVTARAGVSRKTFYELFADKEQCFIAAADTGRELMVKRLEASFARSSAQSLAPVATLRASIHAFLGIVADEPEFARAFFLETATAGGRAQEHQDACRSWFAQSMRAWHAKIPGRRHVPPEIYMAAADATHEAVCRLLRQGRIGEVPALEDAVLHICLALMGVAEDADDGER
ncbi:TetR/AcrR family transcriptional regulator [Nonomuraea lactucae]|uniref:TetR/AcrR family transcriptional regulator n=1 Tax=Nonomuraea lactucae TaxID=2249762 RepID=UPI000DE2A780|nr:TetR/AcrR family transcriptional regulator [Nonomuraea lactucae]